jgi:hypothetical protein
MSRANAVNTNDPYSPNTRRVADAFWRACLGEPQTFKNDMKAVAAALRAVTDLGYEVEAGEWFERVVNVCDLYAIANELEESDES